jgi:hypothetical protein
MLQFWKKHFLLCELILALLITAAFGWWYLHDGKNYTYDLLKDNRQNIYGVAASIYGSLLGFAITAASIVIGFINSPRLRVVRNSPHYPTIWKVFFSTIKVLGLATIFSFLALIFDKNTHPINAIFIAFFYTTILSLFRILRSIWVLENIIKILSAGQQTP